MGPQSSCRPPSVAPPARPHVCVRFTNKASDVHCLVLTRATVELCPDTEGPALASCRGRGRGDLGVPRHLPMLLCLMPLPSGLVHGDRERWARLSPQGTQGGCRSSPRPAAVALPGRRSSASEPFASLGSCLPGPAWHGRCVCVGGEGGPGRSL